MSTTEQAPEGARPTHSQFNAGFDVEAHLDEFGLRFVVEALQAATAAYWDRRAAQFEDALPRPSDYPGKASDAERVARAQRLKAKADACRKAGTFWRSVHGGA
jgi:hypothetical protein